MKSLLRLLSRIWIRLLAFNALLVFLPAFGLLTFQVYEAQLLEMQERSMVQQGRLLAAALARDGALLFTPSAPPLTEPIPKSPIVLIGPEGGWSQAELHLASDRHVSSFGLGPRTLRTETAAISAATVLQWLGGDLR